jgi:hypothetical protein
MAVGTYLSKKLLPRCRLAGAHRTRPDLTGPWLDPAWGGPDLHHRFLPG